MAGIFTAPTTPREGVRCFLAAGCVFLRSLSASLTLWLLRVSAAEPCRVWPRYC